MGRKPAKSKHPKSKHFVSIELTGAEKNRLIDSAEKADLPLGAFIRWIIWEYCQSEKGMPPAPAPYPAPTTGDALRSYLAGEKLLMPCGKEVCSMELIEFGDSEYCSICNLRVS